jgi:hypothetical protein
MKVKRSKATKRARVNRLCRSTYSRLIAYQPLRQCRVRQSTYYIVPL